VKQLTTLKKVVINMHNLLFSDMSIPLKKAKEEFVAKSDMERYLEYKQKIWDESLKYVQEIFKKSQ